MGGTTQSELEVKRLGITPLPKSLKSIRKSTGYTRGLRVKRELLAAAAASFPVGKNHLSSSSLNRLKLRKLHRKKNRKKGDFRRGNKADPKLIVKRGEGR